MLWHIVFLDMQEGPIKEHLLEEAYQKRQRHKDDHQGLVDATDVDRFADAEDVDVGDGPSSSKPRRSVYQDAEYEELDGEQISAFNMKDEKEEGYNEDTGEIIKRKDEDADDPWLQSLQHEVVRARTHAHACRASAAAPLVHANCMLHHQIEQA
jgi:hypothetical protein